MVGRDAVDRFVDKAGDERFPVFAGPERRIHLEAAVFLQVIFIQQKEMGRSLTAHVHSAPLGVTDDLHAFFR